MNDKMTLLDGSTIDCYPITEPSKITDDGNFILDTTGQYLQIGRKNAFRYR